MENKPYAYRVDGGLLLFGERGRDFFNKILNTPPREYDAKKAFSNPRLKPRDCVEATTLRPRSPDAE